MASAEIQTLTQLAAELGLPLSRAARWVRSLGLPEVAAKSPAAEASFRGGTLQLVRSFLRRKSAESKATVRARGTGAKTTRSAASKILARHKDKLMCLQGVAGVGIGSDADSQAYVRVYGSASKNQIEGLPTSLEGVPVVVVPAAKIVPRAAPAKPGRRKSDRNG